MKTHKIILQTIIFLLCVGMVFGANEIPGSVSYWNAETGSGNAIDQWGSNDCTPAGDANYSNEVPTYNTSGTGGDWSFNFDGTGDYFDCTNSVTLNPSSTLAVSLWIRQPDLSTATANRGYFGRDLGGSLRAYYFGNGVGGADLYGAIFQDSDGAEKATYSGNTSTSGLTDNAWYNVILIADGSKVRTFLNAAPWGVSTSYNGGLEPETITSVIGALRSDGSFPMNGQIDDVMFFNSTLTLEEISNIYNYGEPDPIVATNMTITANDTYSGEAISNFCVLIQKAAATIESSCTTTGTLTTTVLTNITDSYYFTPYNVTDRDGYLTSVLFSNKDPFNSSRYLLQPSSSPSFNMELTQSIVRVNATNIFGDSVSGTFTINGSTATNPDYLSIGTYNITFTNASYYTQSQLFSVAALSNTTKTVENMSNTKLTIGVRNAYTNNPIPIYTGWAYYNATGFNQSFSTTSTTTILNLMQGEWYVFVDAANYSISPDNYLNPNITSTTHLINYTLYSENSIRASIYDDVTNTLITEQISITITGNASESNYTTTNGTFFIDDLQDGNYTMKFSGANYTLRSYTVTVADRSTQSLDVYLSASTDTVIFTVRDDLSENTVEGADVSMYKLINSSWALIETKFTDITGRVQLTYTPLTKYRFYVSKTGYTTKQFDLDPIIFDAYDIRLNRNVVFNYTSDYAGISLVYYPVTFYNNQTNEFTFVISSPDGSLQAYGFNLTYPGGSYNWSDNNAIGETHTVNFTISNAGFLDSVNITYFYDLTTGNPHYFFKSYGIYGWAVGNQTMLHNLNNEEYGFGDLEKILIALVFVLFAAGMTFLVAGSTPATLMGLFVYGFFMATGFLPFWSLAITLLIGFILIVAGNKNG